jgi:hypothetical protein
MSLTSTWLIPPNDGMVIGLILEQKKEFTFSNARQGGNTLFISQWLFCSSMNLKDLAESRESKPYLIWWQRESLIL